MTFLFFLIGCVLGCYFGFRLGAVAALGLEFRILFFNKDLFAWRQLHDINKIAPSDRLLLAYEIKREDAIGLLKTQNELNKDVDY